MKSEVLIRISKDEVERARLMSEYKYVVDTQSKVVQAKREGRKEGLQKGRQESRIEIALAMKGDGAPVERIMKYTGLSAAEIAAL
jgi:predicted transposase/invertase (TIGR01784 family)